MVNKKELQEVRDICDKVLDVLNKENKMVGSELKEIKIKLISIEDELRKEFPKVILKSITNKALTEEIFNWHLLIERTQIMIVTNMIMRKSNKCMFHDLKRLMDDIEKLQEKISE